MRQIAQVPTFVRLGLLCLLGLGGGCVSAKTEARTTALEQAVAQLRQENAGLTAMVEELISEIENDRRRASREKYCRDPDISRFMTDLQEGLPDTCTADALNNALAVLRKLPCGIAHLKPEIDLRSLRPTRVGQIRGILDPDKLHPSTRLVVMVKPAEDTEAGRNQAMELAKQFKDRILRKELPTPPKPHPKDSILKNKEVPIMGPYLLPCQLRGDISELYKKSFFRPIQGEPPLGKPSVVLFVFVSDC